MQQIFAFAKNPFTLASNDKSNSCGVAIGYIGNNKVDVLDKEADENGLI